MKEEWRVVPGHEEFEASDWGRIREHDSKKVIRDKPRKSREVKRYTMIALAFLGPKPKGHIIHHKDFNYRNNVPYNLEYLTKQKHRALHVGSEPIHYIADDGTLACWSLKAARKSDSTNPTIVTCEVCKRIIDSNLTKRALLNTVEAGRILGIKPYEVRKLVKAKELIAVRNDSIYFKITLASVEVYQERRKG